MVVGATGAAVEGLGVRAMVFSWNNVGLACGHPATALSWADGLGHNETLSNERSLTSDSPQNKAPATPAGTGCGLRTSAIRRRASGQRAGKSVLAIGRIWAVAGKRLAAPMKPWAGNGPVAGRLGLDTGGGGWARGGSTAKIAEAGLKNTAYPTRARTGILPRDVSGHQPRDQAAGRGYCPSFKTSKIAHLKQAPGTGHRPRTPATTEGQAHTRSYLTPADALPRAGRIWRRFSDPLRATDKGAETGILHHFI